MIDDGTFRFVYDAWNRLIKVQSSKDSGAVTFQTAEFDGTGRRIKKSVTNSGDFDATTRYYYDGQKIVETRVGDNPTTYHQQFIHGTQYIDELVMIRVKDKGDLYVHQDANWNVIGLTDLGGHLVERYVLTPYGELTVYQETGYGDRDGDGDVDATDKGTPGSTCTGTVSGECRVLDLDFDGDYDSTDAGLFDSLPQGLARHPGRIATAVHQPFGHQGLLFEPEIGSYQNRARQYDPGKRRFVQRDPAQYTDGLSMYAYGRGNPHRFLDLTGMDCCNASEPGNDFIGEGLETAAGWVCCDCDLSMPQGCIKRTCIDPQFEAEAQDDRAVECVQKHEDSHVKRGHCEFRDYSCSWKPDLPPKQEECAARSDELRCLREKTRIPMEPVGPWLDDHCSVARCLKYWICDTGYDIKNAVEECRDNSGNFGGCDVIPDEPCPP